MDEPISEHKGEPMAEPLVKPRADPMPEPKADPMVEPKADQKAIPKAELLSELKAKPQAGPMSEIDPDEPKPCTSNQAPSIDESLDVEDLRMSQP